MLLNDRLLRERCEEIGLINPFPDDHQFQPASIDLRLGGHFKVPRFHEVGKWDDHYVPEGEKFQLYPGTLVLATTAEMINLPSDLGARVEGRSSLGRRGLLAHATAGWIDPGFQGHITMELYNAGPWTLELEVGMRICQVAVWSLSAPAERPYGTTGVNKYQHQHGTTSAREDVIK